MSAFSSFPLLLEKLFLLSLLSLLMTVIVSGQTLSACNCFECKEVKEGPYLGSYYSMGEHTGGCLYREPNSGRIIRACDSEATLGDDYLYAVCEDTSGPDECIEPPDAVTFGFKNRTWDGTKTLQTSYVSYYCEPPKKVNTYNGSAVFNIYCSASDFPRWQFTTGYNNLPLCVLPGEG